MESQPTFPMCADRPGSSSTEALRLHSPVHMRPGQGSACGTGCRTGGSGGTTAPQVSHWTLSEISQSYGLLLDLSSLDGMATFSQYRRITASLRSSCSEGGL